MKTAIAQTGDIRPKQFLRSFLPVAAIVLFARWPFLAPGYGTDRDAWAVIRAGRNIAITGEYEFARAPGNPLHEYACAWLWRLDPWILNGLTALMTAVSAGFLAAAFRRLGVRDSALAATAFAFVPPVFIASTSSIDYMWAMCFASAALYSILRGSVLLPGVLLGLAVGFRITSCLLVVPFSLFLIHGRTGKRALLAWVCFAGSAGLIGLAAFTPVFLNYKWDVLAFFDYPRTVMDGIRSGTAGLWSQWGLLGNALALGGICLHLVRKEKSTASLTTQLPRLYVAACLLGLTLYVALFVRLPHEPGYLIPILPFLLILYAAYAVRWSFVLCCLLLLVSPFLRVWPPLEGGRLLEDHRERKAESAYCDEVDERVKALPDQSLIIAGMELPMIQFMHPQQYPGQPFHAIWSPDPAANPNRITYAQWLSEAEFDEYLEKGYHIFYLNTPGPDPGFVLPDVVKTTRWKFGFDIVEHGAQPLFDRE